MPEGADPTQPWRPRNPFRTLRYRDFRLLWSGEVLRTSSQWMDTITRGFLVLELTGSGAQLALVTAVRELPLLLVGFLAGILADRISRKRLIMASQTMNVVAHVTVGLLFLTGLIELWHVYATALVVGVGMALNAPARQSALPSMVPSKELQGAVVLNTATLNIGQAIGPAIGGACVALLGIGGSYLVQASLFAAAGLIIQRIHLPHVPAQEREQWRTSALDGLRYVRRHALLPALLLISLVPMLFVAPFRGVVPAIATEQLGLDAARTGVLMAALGAGAIVSVITLASLPPVRRPGRHIIVSAVGFAISIAIFALVGSYAIAAAALFAAGLLQAYGRTLTQALLLSDTEDGYRGRVSSIWVVNRGMMPVGSTMLAGLTVVLSVANAVTVMSILAVVVVGCLGLAAKALWRR